MKVTMIWANIEEDKKGVMARFFNGLSLDITNIVELHCVELEDMVYMTMKVKRQCKQKDAT